MTTRIGRFVDRFFAIIFITCVFVFTVENINAFSFDLYQRDSYGSPFYDPNLSKTEIILKTIARSVNRSSNMITPNSPISELVKHDAQFLMKIRIGTPTVDIIALVDTGSDLTWIPCKPCTACTHVSVTLFDPSQSSSYSKVSCGINNPCPPESLSRCGEDGFCHYIARYSDATYSRGILSTEIMKMESTVVDQEVEISSFTFGCGTDNKINPKNVVSAVIGLGAGEQSLVTQLGPHGMMRFSYCLIPLGSQGRVSHIRFGIRAKVLGLDVTKVRMVHKTPPHLYFMTLEALTVGKKRIEFTGMAGTVEEGNIVIDSNHPMTELPSKFYYELRYAVKMQTRANPVPDPNNILDLCFKKDEKLKLPNIVANFKGGDVTLKRYNAYVTLGQVVCLAFIINDEMAIYGTLAQQNFIVGYDRLRNSISFKSSECINY